MSSLSAIYITLNSFNQKSLQEKGQQAFIDIVQKTGAEGIEIRRELLRNEQDLTELSNELRKTKLKVVYSAPVPIWNGSEQLNRQELLEVLKEAAVIHATIVKFPLGHFHQNHSKLEDLVAFFDGVEENITLMVENDQTLYGGNIRIIKRFLENCQKFQIPMQLVFDSGNWHYVKESFSKALQELREFVGYLHLKQVEIKEGQCVTIPLVNENSAEWKKALYILNNVPVAIEFPLLSNESAHFYVEALEKTIQEEVGI